MFVVVLTVIKSTVCLHAEVAIRCLPIAVAAEVLVGAAVDEPLHLLQKKQIKEKKKKKKKHLLKNFGKIVLGSTYKDDDSTPSSAVDVNHFTPKC